MDKREVNCDYLVKYAKYLNGNKTVADFCRDEQIDYLEFVEFVNNWEDKHGERMIESCLENLVVESEYLGIARELPSRAQNMFKEIVPVLNGRDGRSRKRFPETPSFQAELDIPRPDTILRQARLTFPGGACIELEEAALKTLILMVVLYEDFDTWAGQ